MPKNMGFDFDYGRIGIDLANLKEGEIYIAPPVEEESEKERGASVVRKKPVRKRGVKGKANSIISEESVGDDAEAEEEDRDEHDTGGSEAEQG